MSDLICLDCGNDLVTFDDNKYYVCNKCNSEHDIKSNKGCYYCCSDCQDLIIIDSDHEYWCDKCGVILCQRCVVCDEDEFTYCNNCSDRKTDEEEEETIYKCLDCNNKNLFRDFYDSYFCINCNPKMNEKSKKGCFKRCKVCDNFISMNNKKDLECQSCESVICNNCYVKDEEDIIICKTCKEKD